MSLPDAIMTFKLLSQTIFPTEKGNWLLKTFNRATAQTVYDATVLETEIRSLLERKTGNPEQRMMEEEIPKCRVQV